MQVSTAAVASSISLIKLSLLLLSDFRMQNILRTEKCSKIFRSAKCPDIFSYVYQTELNGEKKNFKLLLP